MRIYPEKLSADLSAQLRPIYCISGDETFLVEECADLIRTAARSADYNERKIITPLGGSDPAWSPLMH